MGSTLSGGNNTAGEYIVWNDNASTDSVDSAGVHYFDLKTGVSFEGYTRYGIVYGLSANTAGTQFFHVIASVYHWGWRHQNIQRAVAQKGSQE